MAEAKQLEQALDLTNQILQAIEQVDLEAVAELDQQRCLLIEQYYRDEQAIDSELSLQLKQSNDEVVTRLFDLQKRIRGRRLQMRQSSHASQAYRANQPKKTLMPE